MDFGSVMQIAVDVAMDAGMLLLKFQGGELEQTTKASSVDIVTQADKAAEKLIVERLLKEFPDFHLVGEEGGGQGAPAETAPYHWYVDPIDGTTNFASRIPHYCISIALTTPDAEPVLGLIYDPNRDELFSAIKGRGAYLNGAPMKVTGADMLIRSVIASGFPYDRQTNPDNNAREWTAFIPKVRGLRRMGSAALDFAYIAAGRFDGYWERGLNRWDALAGMLLVTEAGGQVSDYQGGNRPQDNPEGRYVASNGRIHDQMIEILRKP